MLHVALSVRYTLLPHALPSVFLAGRFSVCRAIHNREPHALPSVPLAGRFSVCSAIRSTEPMPFLQFPLLVDFLCVVLSAVQSPCPSFSFPCWSIFCVQCYPQYRTHALPSVPLADRFSVCSAIRNREQTAARCARRSRCWLFRGRDHPRPSEQR